jgi:hypothetical protein
MKSRILIGVFLALWSALSFAGVIKTIQAGATDQTVTLKIIDTDGAPITNATFESAGLDLEYWRHGANNPVDITEVTQTVNGSHTDGGFVHIGHGLYRLDLPDAAVASSATAVDILGSITGGYVIGGTVQLSPPVNVHTFGGTAVTGRDIGASVLLSSGTGTGQLSITSGVVNANATQWAGTDVASATVNANMTQVSGDSGAADALEAAFDGTAGAVAPLGIARQGTAQSATSTTLVLDSSASFADDVPIGMTLMACGSTQGYCQARVITDYTNSNDTATVSTWGVTPSGTITYYLFGSAPVEIEGGGGSGPSASEIAQAIAELDVSDNDDVADSWGERIARIPNAAAGSNGGLPTVDGSNRVTALISSGTGSGQLSISSGLLTWNPAWDAEVQSEVADAFGVYDPPTNAEMEARTLASASYATASNQSTMDGKLDGIKAVTDNLPDSGALTSLATATDQTAIKTVTDKLDDTLEDNSGTYRFTESALAQAPAGEGGGGTGTDWDADERAAIRSILGIPVSGSTPADPSSGILDTIRDGITGLNDIAATDLRDLVIEDQGGGVSLGCALSVLLAYAAGDLATTSNSPTYEDPSGTETRISGAISSAGNRSMTITCPSY